MLELIGAALGLAIAATVALIVIGLFVVPILLFLTLLGFTLRVAASALGWLLGGLLLIPLGVLLVPIAVVVGGLLLLKLAILLAPLALVGLVVWALVAAARQGPPALPAAQASSVSPVSPASARRT